MTSDSTPSFATGFMPHGMCYLWQPDILALHIASDLLIGLSYFSIPFTLIYFIRRRRDFEFHWMFVCFAVFIVACGTTHLMEIWVIWHPMYWLSGAIKAVTAMASVPTAILLIKLVPAALQLPSPAALRSVNERLTREAARGTLAAIVESSDDAIISKTPDGTITSWNQGAERIFGYTEAEAIGRPATMLFPPDRIDDEIDILRRVGMGERVASFETVRVRKNGMPIDVSITISPIRGVDGSIVGASKIARDISERKRVEAELKEQAEIVNLAQVLVRDSTGRILSWSRGAERLYGYSREEALGKVSHELFRTTFPVSMDRIQETLERDGEWEGELTHFKRDGSQIHVASLWVLHRDASGRPGRIMESDTDVTDRKLAENKLAAQLARMHLLNTITRAIGERQDFVSIFNVVIGALEDHLPIDFGCLCLFQPPDILRVVGVGAKSHALATKLGMTDKALVEVDQNGLLRCVRGELVHEPDLQTVHFPFPQRMHGVGLSSMVAAPLLVEGKVFGILLAARRTARSFSSGECEFLGQLSAHVAIAAHQTQLYGALQAAYEDLRQTQQAVMRQEKLRVLGQMASGIAHDINNALSPAALYVEMLLNAPTVQATEARGYLVIIQHAIDGVAQTVARMKEFYGHPDPGRMQNAVSLNTTVEQVLDLTRVRWHTMPHESAVEIQAETQLTPNLPTILGDENEIRDALTNLIINAVDAMPEGGRLIVSTRTASAGRVMLEVTDTGIGMDEATRNRCLELFFTTKGVRGTGLGLAMVYGAVERHGGELQIESAPGNGTTVRLLFPAAAAALAGNTRPQADVRPLPSLHILVVDDDPIVLQSLRITLGQDGHRVETADGGQLGIDAFGAALARGEPFAAVITDLGMPGVDGRSVATAIKSMRAQTPVILLTGWGNRLLVENDAPPGVDRVLPKPPQMTRLRAVLAELTTGSPA